MCSSKLIQILPGSTRQLHFRTLNTNVAAQFWTLKSFLPNMIKEKQGHVVSNSISLPNAVHNVSIRLLCLQLWALLVQLK